MECVENCSEVQFVGLKFDFVFDKQSYNDNKLILPLTANEILKWKQLRLLERS